MKKLKVVLFIIILFLISLIIVFAINKIPRCLGKILPNEDIIDAYYYVDHYSSNENQRIIKTKKIDNDKIDEFLSNVSEMKYVKYNNIFSAKGFWEGEKTLYIYYKNYEVIINEYYIYINEGIYKDDSNFDFIKRIKTVRYHKYYGFSFEEISSLFYDIDNEASLKSNPVQQLIQPINYDTFDDLINAIKNKEVPYNREEYKEEYIKYMETIYNNEYLIKLSFKDCEDVYWKTLYPKALYEDLGYSYWLKYNEKDYQIIIYYFDQDIYSEEDDIDEYIHNRMSDKATFTNTNINIDNKDYTCFKTTNNQLLMKIDDVRYLWIKSSQDLDSDDALDLLGKFDSFEYLYFNDK